MAFKHVDKKKGQLIKADDWNAMGRELERLEGGKVQRTGGDTLDGDVKVTGSLELGRGKAVKEFSTDKKLGGNSNLAVPTESAVKSYVDTSLKQKAALEGAPDQDFQTRGLSVSDNLHLAPDHEIFFADNGQIRSHDDNHRILFRRSSNTLELREYGDITFSPGAMAGKETAKVVMTGSGDVGIGTTAPETRLDVRGVIRADRVEATNPDLLRHRMYPDDPIVYQEIFDAQEKGAIAKLGNPSYDASTYKKTLHFARHIIRFGSDNEAVGNGALVNIPDSYDTVWVRVLGDRWTVFKAYFIDGEKENLGLWAGGYRSTNGYCPDGSLSDGYNDPNHQIKGGSKLGVHLHQWLPIPARRAGKLALIPKLPTNWDFWLSGLAFSRNPWAHAAQSAVAYHWKLNGGTAVKWHSHDWNQDVLAQIVQKSKFKLMVPVVPSGRDKLLYLVEHNNNWNGCAHNGITVNGQPIERFLATYDNPFARHWNSKFYERYIAARIPAGLIPDNARWLNVQIDMSKQNASIYFREIGTHDLDIAMNVKPKAMAIKTPIKMLAKPFMK